MRNNFRNFLGLIIKYMVTILLNLEVLIFKILKDENIIS